MRTTKLIILSSALYLFTAFQHANGQVYLGVKGGLGIPNLSAGDASPVAKGYSSIEGPYFGIFAELPVTHKFSIQAELNYSQQGGKKNGAQAIPSGEFTAGIPAGVLPPGYTFPDYFYANFDSKAHLNYLELPILAKFNFSLGGPWRFIIDAGPYFGYLMNAKDITTNGANSTIYTDAGETMPFAIPNPANPTAPPTPVTNNFNGTQSITEDTHRFNFGIQGGVGFEYFTGKTGYIYLQGGGNYGLVNIQKGTENGKNQTGAGTVAIGYAFSLCQGKHHKK